MILRGIDFGYVRNSSGARGFFGEEDNPEYWHHSVPVVSPKYKGATFISKTATLQPRLGNMPLTEDWRPLERFPRCIAAGPRYPQFWLRGIALNAVGLSNPGVQALLETGRWQKRTEPFFISFMAVGDTLADSLEETRGFVRLVNSCRPEFQTLFGIQLNLSCANVGLRRGVMELIEEAYATLKILREGVNLPVEVKLDVSLPVEAGIEISLHDGCDSICMGNAVRYGAIPDKIDWNKICGGKSPLAEFGGGALSGRLLRPLTVEWVSSAKEKGIKKPITGCGGVLSKMDAWLLLAKGANAIEVGSASFLRSHRVQGIVEYANEYGSYFDDR